eukprot:1159093-Pelagomonas_calceolata.AAC.3
MGSIIDSLAFSAWPLCLSGMDCLIACLPADDGEERHYNTCPLLPFYTPSPSLLLPLFAQLMLGNDEGPPGRFQGCKRGVSRGCPCCVGPQIRKLGQFMLAKSLKSKFASSLKLVSNPTLMPQVNICEMYCPEVMVKQGRQNTGLRCPSGWFYCVGATDKKLGQTQCLSSMPGP